MNYSLAVLLTCHNRREKTIRCLHALYQSTFPENYTLDVFLVDDGSTDGTSETVNASFPEVNLVHGNGDLFWNRGMYLAWSSAIKKKEYDYYLWLNDDTLMFENALKVMLEYSQSVKNTRIVIGATCSEVNGSVTYSGFNFPKIKILPNGTWQDCDYFNGNMVLIPSAIYSKVGLLDNRFRHALGDFDYGMRASKLGLVHSLSPHCLGYCESHESDPKWRNRSIPFIKRIKYLYTPLGNNPIEFFTFDLRHYGFILALIHFFSIHLRTLFPARWENPNK